MLLLGFTLLILLKCHNLSTHSFNFIFCWLPSPVGIPGNEKADKAAKSALNKPILRIPILCTDLKPIINKYIYDKWQQTYYQIYPTIPSYFTLSSSYQRKDLIIYNRLRIGHTRLAHSYLNEHTDPPKCTNCNQLLSVRHILTKCASCDQTRHQ